MTTEQKQILFLMMVLSFAVLLDMYLAGVVG